MQAATKYYFAALSEQMGTHSDISNIPVFDASSIKLTKNEIELFQFDNVSGGEKAKLIEFISLLYEIEESLFLIANSTDKRSLLEEKAFLYDYQKNLEVNDYFKLSSPKLSAKIAGANTLQLCLSHFITHNDNSIQTKTENICNTTGPCINFSIRNDKKVNPEALAWQTHFFALISMHKEIAHSASIALQHTDGEIGYLGYEAKLKQNSTDLLSIITPQIISNTYGTN